jgi:DNA-binding transcriptional MocR family regulator
VGARSSTIISISRLIPVAAATVLAIRPCASFSTASIVAMGSVAGAPPPSRRILGTDDPCIVAMQKMMRGKEGVLSLAQGIVYWNPPHEAMATASAAMEEASTNSYCADDGLPAFKEMLAKKIREENCLYDSNVMVTSGSNQAYTNVVLATLDAGDKAVLFAPFYFNHAMAVQMTGAEVIQGHSTADLLPDLDWLQSCLSAPPGSRPKLVTLVNPGNPSGVMLPKDLLQRAQALCSSAGAWLVVDNAYEYFSYEADGHPPHACIEGPGVINTFSFSKSFGMMGQAPLPCAPCARGSTRAAPSAAKRPPPPPPPPTLPAPATGTARPSATPAVSSVQLAGRVLGVSTGDG